MTLFAKLKNTRFLFPRLYTFYPIIIPHLKYNFPGGVFSRVFFPFSLRVMWLMGITMGNATILSWNDICSSWMGERKFMYVLQMFLGKIHFKWIITLVNYCLAFFILNWLLIEKVLLLLREQKYEVFDCKLKFVV